MADVPDDEAADNLKEPEGSFADLDGGTQITVIVLAAEILHDSDDLCVFEQDQFWVAGKMAWPLELLDRESILSLVTHLFVNARHFHIRMLQKIAAELLLRSLEGPPDPELPVVKAAQVIVDTEPAEWLNSTPLMRKLTELLDS